MTKNSRKKQELKQTSSSNRYGPPYDAITLDTCIFYNLNFQFNTGALHTLKNIRIEEIISEIICHEIVDHLKEKKNEKRAQLKSVNKKLRKWNLSNPDIDEYFNKISDALGENTHKDNLQQYIDEHDCEIVSSRNEKQGEVISRYFSRKSPFDTTKNKSEFPDAIALLSLEAWAEEKGKKILAISNDNDWLRFSEESDWIDVVPDLKTGLAQITSTNEKVEKWANEFILNLISRKLDEKLINLIDVMLRFSIEEHADKSQVGKYQSYDMPLYFAVPKNIELLEYHLNSLEIPDDESELRLSVVNYTPKDTIFHFFSKVTVSAKAKFEHYVRIDNGCDVSEMFLSDTSEDADAVEIEVRIGFSFKGNVIEEGYIPEISNIDIDGDFIIPFGKISLLIPNVDDWPS
jgi:hypothetical protein